MRLRWKRVNHWKNIRALTGEGDNSKVYAYIQRGRRPNEYTIVFPQDAYVWSLKYQQGKDRFKAKNPLPDFVLTDSSLNAAKAVGMLIIKTQGDVQ